MRLPALLLEDVAVQLPALTSRSRLLLFAPHPDDESLACSILLQRAVRAGAVVRVVYVTDGDDNPWPQRVLERKWRLNATDRRRWGRLRRTEALAALRVLGVNGSAARFLALPDQKLTALLMCDCQSALERFAAIIADWKPTDLLLPSISDTHPDHSALAVMLRLVLSESFSAPMATGQMAAWSYVVHGRSPAFFDRAETICQSDIEAATKLRAIRCHKTQLKLSRKRFLGYAGRPERLVKLGARDKTIADGLITSVFRLPHSLRVELRLSPKAMRMSEPALFVLRTGRSRRVALCNGAHAQPDLHVLKCWTRLRWTASLRRNTAGTLLRVNLLFRSPFFHLRPPFLSSWNAARGSLMKRAGWRSRRLNPSRFQSRNAMR